VAKQVNVIASLNSLFRSSSPLGRLGVWLKTNWQK